MSKMRSAVFRATTGAFAGMLLGTILLCLFDKSEPPVEFTKLLMAVSVGAACGAFICLTVGGRSISVFWLYLVVGFGLITIIPWWYSPKTHEYDPLGTIYVKPKDINVILPVLIPHLLVSVGTAALATLMHRRTNLDSASDEKHQQSPPKPGQVNVHKLLTFGVVFIVGAVLFLVAPGAREPLASQAGCNNNLKQIGIALHNYHDIWRCFPSPHSTDADGKPLHSWRVAIEASTLDSRFDFTLRWNHPRNLMASDPVPYHFKCPRAPQSKGTAFTNYVMVVGQKRRAPSGQEISFDQHSDAIIVVEIADSDIHWTEPRELNFDEMSFKINDKTKPSISSHHVHGAMVLYADGSVHFLNESTNPKELRKLLTENLQDGSGRSQADVPATCDG